MSSHSQALKVARISEISSEEREWAANIKAAAEAAEDIRNVSDMEYVHQAIIAKDDVDGALKRLRGLQDFRDEYKIKDTVEQGIELIKGFLRQQEGFLLTIDVDREKGHFVWVYDTAKIAPERCDYPDDWQIYLGAMYYQMNAMHSNMFAIREGVVHIGECEGMSQKNFNLTHIRRIFSDLCEHYPFQHKELSWIRTPLAANLLYSFMRPLMRSDASYKFQTGCTFSGYSDRLDGLFHSPSAEVSERFLLLRIQEYLTTRYFLEKNYKLPATPTPEEVLSLSDSSIESDSEGEDDQNIYTTDDGGEEEDDEDDDDDL
ncbi:expressed unknown protein [Seminavis robusta]|uniref:CRAL-TRIO domain-containing protein n=1 Tax=Seminavis robusta TaxID=568900 RepID=A0A9N8EVL9_9STRA|nr:expressed unknown protein [Seminavis robusta]|eukprot:Sro1693_g291630.1 n/a (317) ;mRNA; r:5525-6565